MIFHFNEMKKERKMSGNIPKYRTEEEARAANAANARSYYARNKEKVRADQKLYYQKNKERILQQARDRRNGVVL